MRYTLALMRITPSDVRFVRSSDQSLLVYFDQPSDGETHDHESGNQPPRGGTLARANEKVRKLLHLLSSQPISGVRNLHPAYCSLLIKFDPQRVRHYELEGKLREYFQRLEKVRLPEPRLLEIPVCYGEEFGPDLDDVARLHGVSSAEAVRLHTSAAYLVYFLGFVPGFAYLGELPEALVTPRHATPRRKVAAGSVGIAGNQTGVYPSETPGGWRLLGRTPLPMVRLEEGTRSLLSIGDRVRFKSISREEFAALQKIETSNKNTVPPPSSFRTEHSAVTTGAPPSSFCEEKPSSSVIEVRAPGLLTTVQDLGREGFGHIGVSPSGAADAVALRVGNRLVGNAEGAAGLEMTLLGGTFAFLEPAIMALTGADFGATLDNATVPLWTSVEVEAGQLLRMGATLSGARCYLCVRGGIEVKPLLGSASTHLLSGLGGHEGRALKKGDILKVGTAGSSFQRRTVAAKALRYLQPRKILRVTPGPQHDWFADVARRIFHGSTYRVAEESNRMGLRLEGPSLLDSALSGGLRKAFSEMLTEGVPLGAVQVTPSGLPIILFVEQQTTGGYPKIANVISADFSSLGQLRPRDEIRFDLVDWETARDLLIEQENLLTSDALFA